MYVHCIINYFIFSVDSKDSGMRNSSVWLGYHVMIAESTNAKIMPRPTTMAAMEKAAAA